MLLTSLPVIFQIEFFAKIEEAFEWPQMIEDDDPSKLFETLNHEVYLHSESRILHGIIILNNNTCMYYLFSPCPSSCIYNAFKTGRQSFYT
jgi:hypothetical protein